MTLAPRRPTLLWTSDAALALVLASAVLVTACRSRPTVGPGPVLGMPGGWQLRFVVTPPRGARVTVAINDRMIP